MLYLPEKVFRIDGGTGLFLFFHDELDRSKSIEIYLDDDSIPPHVVIYDSEEERAEVEGKLRESAIEIIADDYRIDINGNNVTIIGRSIDEAPC